MPTTRRMPGFASLSAAIAAAMLLLIAVGGAVRATDSGLACPTWPGCFSLGDFLPAWQLNVWLEHTHRLLAGAIAIALAVQLAWAVRRHDARRRVVVASAVALAAVLVQAGLGALVVLHLLRAELVTAHLGMAMVVVACQLLIAVEAAAPDVRACAGARLTRTSAAVAGLTFVQILVGGHVSGIGAGLAFTGDRFPFLGLVSFAPVETPQQVFNVGHRVLAVVLAVAVGVLLARSRGEAGWLRRLPRLAAVLVVVQAGLGVANLASGLSWATVVPHLAVASWLWAALVLHALLAARAAPARVAAERRLVLEAA